MKYTSGDIVYTFNKDNSGQSKLYRLVVDRYVEKHDFYMCYGRINAVHENEMFEHPLDAIYDRRAMVAADLVTLKNQLDNLDDMLSDYQKGDLVL